MYDFFIEPFDSFLFMRRAFAACFALSLGCAPMGVLLVLRRMSLMGDALSHSVLPGVAIGYMISGLSLSAMGMGGFIAGLLIAFIATLVSRHTILREDASFVGFYLIALSLGALMISAVGNNVDLLHILFGQILGVTPDSLILISSITSITLITMSVIYRPLIMECYDRSFMRSIKAYGSFYHIIFMMLVVLNMIAAFQALGTLMALGMMMLPAIAARFWGKEVWSLFLITFVLALVSSYIGLLVSYHFKLPSGPSIILVAGIIYMISLLIGNCGSILRGSAR